FSEPAAILPRHPDRVLSFLGKTSVVDDPRLDRSVMLDLRQHHLAHLGQNLRVRPRRLTNKMQQRLMLRCCPRWSSHRRHRFDALAFARHHQPQAITPQRPRSIPVSDHSRKTLDISRKSRFTIIRSPSAHRSILSPQRESRQIADSFDQWMRLSDSVELEHGPENACPALDAGWAAVFPRDKRGTRLRGDHAQQKVRAG